MARTATTSRSEFTANWLKALSNTSSHRQGSAKNACILIGKVLLKHTTPFKAALGSVAIAFCAVCRGVARNGRDLPNQAQSRTGASRPAGPGSLDQAAQ